MLNLKGGEKMLNEIMQNEELRKRKLTDLYAEGIIGLGDEIPYKHSEETYLSPKERNGHDDQSFSTKDVEMKWQAIGVEEIEGEKCLKLIAKRPIFKFQLRGARGYIYGIEELHRIAQLFATGRGVSKGRSITVEDVNQLLGVVVYENQKKVCHRNDISLNLEVREGFLTICPYLSEYRFYTPESFLKNEFADSGVISNTAYTYDYRQIKEKEEEKKIVFVDNIFYWLASSGVVVCNTGYPKFADFGIGAVIYDIVRKGGVLFGINGKENSRDCLAVRPVLYLNSNVTLNVLL